MRDPTSSPVSGAIGRAGARLLRNRLLVRAPIWLYRARLGFLCGSRLLMLEHRGRMTGAVRRAVLEVVGHPAPDTYVVASGFGTRAQWYRNVLADPHVRIVVGCHGPSPATAHPVPAPDRAAVLADYLGRHRRAWRTLRPVFENTLGAAIDDRAGELPMVALRRAGARS